MADLYDPLTMPPELTNAHQELDRAVDAAYGKKDFKTDAERVAFLFELYQKYTSLLPAENRRSVNAKVQRLREARSFHDTDASVRTKLDRLKHPA